jgi:hypothetical protein
MDLSAASGDDLILSSSGQPQNSSSPTTVIPAKRVALISAHVTYQYGNDSSRIRLVSAIRPARP